MSGLGVDEKKTTLRSPLRVASNFRSKFSYNSLFTKIIPFFSMRAGLCSYNIKELYRSSGKK
jgi:hypothetical protein